MYSNYDKTIVVRIPNNMYLKLKDKCLKYETISDLVRKAISEFIEKEIQSYILR